MLHIALAHSHGSIVLHYVHVSWFIYSAFGGHMCRFQFAIITNSIAMNIFVHFFGEHIFTFLWDRNAGE